MRLLFLALLLVVSGCATARQAPPSTVTAVPLAARAAPSISAEQEARRCKEHIEVGAPYDNKPEAIILCEGSKNGRQALFLVAYNTETRTPDWVAYRLTHPRMATVARTTAERKDRFVSHPRLQNTVARSPSHDDYTRSGYDRGHLAPSRTMQWHVDAWESSYRTTNIAPQFPSMNQNIWRCLEHSVREWAKSKRNVYVITGVLHLPSLGSLSSEKSIRIPSHYYTVVYSPDGGGQSIAFLAENRQLSDDPRDIAKSVDQLEAVAKLDFFKLVPKQIQDAAERKRPDFTEWPIWVPAGRNCVPARPRIASRE